jgi:hypothetical protein
VSNKATTGCLGIIPGTFIICGEIEQYCSTECWAQRQAAAFNRITPERVTHLRPLDVFVFGSNQAGIHGAGAALTAALCFGAKRSVANGPSGSSYAIPTKPRDLSVSLCLRDISKYVDEFVAYAAERQDRCFLITEIGCGLAGYKPSDIAPMFKDCVALPHVCLPQRFWTVL